MRTSFNQKMLAAGVPLQMQQDTRVGATASRALPTGRVQKLVVRQPVNLSPMGNTIALTAPSEMPFTSGRPVTVQTQVSGGISGPPKSMKSKGLRGKYNATVVTNRNQGKQPFAGLGQYDEVPAYSGSAGLRGYVQDGAQRLSGFGAATAPMPTKRAAPALRVPTIVQAGQHGLGDTNWGSIFGTVASTAQQAANALTPKAAPVAAAPAAPASNTTMYLVLGGLAVVGVGYYMMSKKG